MKRSKPPGWLLALAFIAIYFVWGTTYLANLFALEDIPPFIVSCFRYLGAGAVLGIWIAWKRPTLPGKSSFKVLCISGILMLIGGSGLIVFAEQYIKSGYAAALVATEPLWFVLLDKRRWPLYSSNRLILSGLLLGFTGIGLFALFAPAGRAADGHRGHLIAGTAIVLVSAILWVGGTLYASRNTGDETSNTTNTAVQFLAAGIFAGLVALFTGEWHGFSMATMSGKAWMGLLYLIVMGSLIAFLAFTWLVTVQPPAIVSTHTFVNPVVAIIMGWAIAGESITGKQTAALAAAFAGVILAQVGKDRLPRKSGALLSGLADDRDDHNDDQDHGHDTHPDARLEYTADDGTSGKGQSHKNSGKE